MNPPQTSETCPKCGVERTYYDGWNCPTEGCDLPDNLPPSCDQEKPRVRRLITQMAEAFDSNDSEGFFDTFLEIAEEMGRYIDAEVTAAESNPDLKL